MNPTEQVLRETSLRRRCSKLEPHWDLIAGLLKKGVGYREIARVLSERFGLRISKTSVFSFVRVRSTGGPRKRKYELPPSPPVCDPLPSRAELRTKLEMLKRQSKGENTQPKKLFEYEEGRPLTLKGNKR